MRANPRYSISKKINTFFRLRGPICLLGQRLSTFSTAHLVRMSVRTIGDLELYRDNPY